MKLLAITAMMFLLVGWANQSAACRSAVNSSDLDRLIKILSKLKEDLTSSPA